MVTTKQAFRKIGRGLAAGSVIGAGIGFIYAAPAAANDPCATFFAEVERIDAEMGAARSIEEECQILPRFNSILGRVHRGDIPTAVTAASAVAALRLALQMDHLEPPETNLIRTALAYLEREAA